MGGLAGAVVFSAALAACPALAKSDDTRVAEPKPVQAVGPGRLPVGGGILAYYASHDLSVAQPAVTRAVVIVHGLNRDAGPYFATTEAARRHAGTDPATVLVIAPQFLATTDAPALPATLLRWSWNHWADGSDAVTPGPVSSYAALDAVLAPLADSRQFPALRQVVVAGFSAGGQTVQRYAALGHATAALVAAGRHVRFVVGSPSSYLYFSADRPGPVAGCAAFNAWRYGLAGGVPAYAGPAPDAASLEQFYASLDMVYLLGGADTDPQQRVLDRSCAAEAQGPTRLARGQAFFANLQAREQAAAHQRQYVVPGVGHNARRVLTSPCGVAALFDAPGCPQP